jgi:anion-transporting  ArsA/GET3 family ATPase
VRDLLDKRLIFVTGKGGVGKTTVTASLARMAASRGRTVLVCEVDTDASMGHIFGSADIGFEPTRVEPRIYAANLTRDECMKAFVQRFLPSRRVADMVLKNRVARIFFDSAPSVMEAVILDQLATLAEQSVPRFDLVIVDLPASGHALTFLDVPRSMVEMVRVGNLAKHMQALAERIADPAQSELLLVALPEELSVNETIELWTAARERLQIRTHRVVINGLRERDVRPGDAAVVRAAIEAGADAEATERVAWGTQLGTWWREQDRANADRLHAAIDGQVVEVPLVFARVDERDLVEHVASALNGAVV